METLTPFFVGFVALFFCSCFEQKDTITLNADGSGTVEQSLLFEEEMWNEIKNELDQKNGPLDPTQYKEIAEAMGEGVEFQSVEVVQDGDKNGLLITFSFTDINTLKFFNSMDASGAAENTPLYTFALENKELTVQQHLIVVDPEEAEQNEDEIDPVEADFEDALDDSMREAFADVSISRKLVIAPGIAATDASFVADNTITLYQLPFAPILQKEDPELIDALFDDSSGEGEFTQSQVEKLNSIDGVEIEPALEFNTTLN